MGSGVRAGVPKVCTTNSVYACRNGMGLVTDKFKRTPATIDGTGICVSPNSGIRPLRDADVVTSGRGANSTVWEGGSFGGRAGRSYLRWDTGYGGSCV